MDTIDIVIDLLALKGVSGAKMSKYLGFSNAVFSQWKSRKQKPSADKISRMAEYFNVSVDYLMGNKEQEKSPTILTDDERLKYSDEIMSAIKELPEEKRKMALEFIKTMVQLEKQQNL